MIESCCQSVGIAGVPQPRCRLSRAESRSIHSSHSSPHPRKWRSTFEPSIWMTRAGYHRFCTSSASTSESTVSDLRQSSGGSLSRSRFRDDDDASGGSLSRSAGRFRDIDMPSRRRCRVAVLCARADSPEGDGGEGVSGKVLAGLPAVFVNIE